MKVKFIKDEWSYPYFILIDKEDKDTFESASDIVLDIPEDILKWVKEGISQINEVQRYLYLKDKEQNK